MYISLLNLFKITVFIDLFQKLRRLIFLLLDYVLIISTIQQFNSLASIIINN